MTDQQPDQPPPQPPPPPAPPPRWLVVRRFFALTPKTPNYVGDLLMIGGGGALSIVALILFLSASSSGATGSEDPAQLAGAVPGLCLGFIGVTVGVIGGVLFLQHRAKYQRAYYHAEPKPPVEWIRGLVNHELRRIEEHALAELRIARGELQALSDAGTQQLQREIAEGLAPGQHGPRRPMMIIGPALPTALVTGEQGTYFSRYRFAVICPTGWQFGIYTCTLDLETGNLGTEEARWFPYSQVSAVTAGTRPLPPIERGAGPAVLTQHPVKLGSLETRYLQILVSGGDRAEVSLGFIDQATLHAFRSDLMPSFEHVVDAVSTALRHSGTMTG
ncbi:hypothetical protein [Longispora albida]|uniref:hypothetical protein n=1 Tax=Longispora albida TaxID=203523 RepID=UPI000368F54E|nr:hypothetical protein [Longispora albida]